MKKHIKRKSPSRVKYEQGHPVASFRISKKLNDRIQVIRKTEKRSLTQILEAGAGLLEVKIRSEEQVRQKAFQEGQIKGYKLAESAYNITFPCSVCGQIMEVSHIDTKKAVRKFLIDGRWGHEDCIDRNY